MAFRKNIFWAIPFIVVGIVWLLKNMGMIATDIFDIIVSWQMLVMYVGVFSFFSRRYVGGGMTFLFGLYFLMPELDWMDGSGLTIWPLLLVLAGIVILFSPRKKNDAYRKNRGEATGNEADTGTKSEFVNIDGYVESDNTFSSVEQIILEPVFKGARIKVLFGGTILDLRRTKLEGPRTYIDIDCTFAGVEIYVPNDWRLHFNVRPLLGGVEDKRFNASVDMDKEHVLVVRGNATFGGIEFKS